MWLPTRIALLKFQKAERLIPNALASTAVLARAEELAELESQKIPGHKNVDFNFNTWNQFNDHYGIEARGFNYNTAQKLLFLSDRFTSETTNQKSEPAVIKEDPYSEKFLRSPNQSGKIAPKFIVLHDSEGSFVGGVDWIRQFVSRVSYHYLIDTDGSRVQFVWDTRRAWHAGKSKWLGYNGLNSYSVGVALSGDTRKRYAKEAEIDSMARKVIYLLRKFGLSRNAVVTHEMISPGRKTDTSQTTYKRVKERVDYLWDKI